MVKKISILFSILFLTIISFFQNTQISLSASSKLLAVNDLQVSGDNGNYTVSFTDSNDFANVDSYLLNYYSIIDGKKVIVETELISESGVSLKNILDFNSGDIIYLTLIVKSNTTSYSDSDESNEAYFVYYPAMFQQGIIINNLITYDMLPHNTSTGESYLEAGYDFAIYKNNVITSSVSSGYSSSYNQVYYSFKNNNFYKDHLYYFSFNYKYNNEKSNYRSIDSFEVYFNNLILNENSRLFPIKFVKDLVTDEYRYSVVFRPVSNSSLSELVFCGVNGNTNATTLESYSIKDVMLIDLTESYGLYKEPSLSSMDEYVNNFGKIDSVILGNDQILGPQYLEATCTDPLVSSEILSHYSTIIEDSTIYISESNYFNNSSIAGTYYVTLAFKDTFGNVYNRIVNIVVKDNIPPIIKLDGDSDRLISYVSSPLTSAELLSHVIITDNNDNNLKDVASINASTYLANNKIPGVYSFVVEVVDSAGNVTSETFYIEVINDLGPTIDAPTVIYKSEDIVFTLRDVLSTINSIVDQEGNEYEVFIDGELNSDFIIIVKDTFTGNVNTEGSYDVTLKAWDRQGRVSYHTITIKVIDDIKNIVMYNSTIYVSHDTKLENNDIIKILKKSGISKFDNSDSNITFPINEYEANNYTSGQTYSVKVRYIINGGYEYNVSLNIKVLDTNTISVDNSLVAKIGRFFSDNWYWLIGGVVVIAVCAILSNIKTNPRRRFR